MLLAMAEDEADEQIQKVLQSNKITSLCVDFTFRTIQGKSPQKMVPGSRIVLYHYPGLCQGEYDG